MMRRRAAFLAAATVGGILAVVLAAPASVAQVTPPQADIAVTVTGTPAVAKLGDTVTFVVTVVNNGPDTVSGVHLANLLPPGLANASWACQSSGTVVCSALSGTGNIGQDGTYAAQDTLSVTLTGQVLAMPLFGQIVDMASANSQTPGFADSNPANNFAQAIVQVAALQATKSVQPTDISLGSTVTYTIALTNPGLGAFGDAQITDDLSDDLDDATFASVTVTGGSPAVFADPFLTWIGTVPGQGTVTITYTLTVNDPATGDGRLANVIVANAGNCVAGSTDPACATEVTTPTEPTLPTEPTTPATTPPEPTTAATTPPEPTTAATTPTEPTSSGPGDTAGVTPSVLDTGATAGSDLPGTGDATRVITLVALLAVACGSAVIVAATRRRSAD